MWVILLPEVQKITYQNANNQEHVIYHAIELEMLGDRFGYYNTGKKLSDPTEKPSRISNVFDCVPIDRLLKKEKRTNYYKGLPYTTDENVTIIDEIRNLKDFTGRILEDWVFEPIEINHTLHHIAHIVTTLQHNAERSAMLEGVYQERGDVYLEASTDLPFPPFLPSNAWSHYEPRYETRARPERSIYHIHDTHTGAFVAATTKRPSSKRDAKKPTLLDDLYAYEYVIQDDGMIVYTHPTGRVMKVKPSVLEQR